MIPPQTFNCRIHLNTLHVETFHDNWLDVLKIQRSCSVLLLLLVLTLIGAGTHPEVSGAPGTAASLSPSAPTSHSSQCS